MTEKKKHLSISQLDLLSKCGYAWYLRYVMGIIAPPGIALIIGSGVDAPISADMMAKALDGSLLPEETIKDLASDKADELWETVELQPDEIKEGKRKLKGETKDMTVNLSLLHHREFGPEITPKMYMSDKGMVPAVQRWFRLELEGYDYDLVGVMDQQEVGRIRDTKTIGKSPAKDAADRSMQLTLYSLAAEVIDGEQATEVCLDFLVKNQTPKAVTQKSTRTAEDHLALLNRVEAATKVIDAGAFVPARPDDWWCSPQWCGYYHCKYVGRSRLVQIT